MVSFAQQLQGKPMIVHPFGHHLSTILVSDQSFVRFDFDIDFKTVLAALARTKRPDMDPEIDHKSTPKRIRKIIEQNIKQ